MSERTGKVQTVLGLTDPSELGTTLMHEHIVGDFTPPERRPEPTPPIRMEDRWQADYEWVVAPGNVNLTARDVALREMELLVEEVRDLGSAALRRDAGRTLDGSLTLAAERQQSRDAIRRDLELVDTIISLKRARAANGTSQGGDPRSGTAPRVIDASKGTAQPKAATSRPQPPGPPPIAPRQSRKHSRSKPNQAPLAPLTSKSLTPEQGPLAPPPGPARPSEAKRAQPRRPTRSAKGRDGQEL